MIQCLETASTRAQLVTGECSVMALACNVRLSSVLAIEYNIELPFSRLPSYA